MSLRLSAFFEERVNTILADYRSAIKFHQRNAIPKRKKKRNRSSSSSSSAASSPERKRKYVKHQPKQENAAMSLGLPVPRSAVQKVPTAQTNGKGTESSPVARTRSYRRHIEPVSVDQPSTSLPKLMTTRLNNAAAPVKSAIVENSIKHLRNQTAPSSTSQSMTATQLRKNSVPKENLEKEKPLKRKMKGVTSKPQVERQDVVLPVRVQVNGHSSQVKKPGVRGRPPGRKSKIVLNNNASNSDPNNSVQVVPKKRGRKPKYPRNDDQQQIVPQVTPGPDVSPAKTEKEQPTSSSCNSHAELIVNENEVPKKRRGRKPKIRIDPPETNAALSAPLLPPPPPPPPPPPQPLPTQTEPENAKQGNVKIQTRSKCKKLEEPMDVSRETSEGLNHSESQMRTRNQGRRTAFYNEDDSEEEQRQLLFEDTSLTFGTSSRGRVRKLTEKAKANLIGW